MSVLSVPYSQYPIIELSGCYTIEEGLDYVEAFEHPSERDAGEYFARRALEAEGWHVTGPAADEGYRLPVAKAAGFTAERGSARVRLDVSGNLPPVLLVCKGEVEQAIEFIAAAFPAIGIAYYEREERRLRRRAARKPTT